MANTFQFIGKISRRKENAFVEKSFDSGWIINELNFSMVCGDNVQFLRASGGMWGEKHSSKNSIMTYKYNENGKDEPITIKWDDRLNPEIVATIANYRTYTVDTEIIADRKTVEEIGDEVAIEASKKKHKVFITAIDFVKWLDKVTSNEKTKDWIWKVTGEVEYSYSKGIWYRNFVPRRVYHVDPTTEQQCIGTIKTFFTDDCVSEDDNTYYFNTYTQYYDQQCKKNCFTPAPIVVPKTHPKAKGFAKIFGKVEDGEVREFGVSVLYINGAQRVQITEDMLSDEQIELLEMNMITMDDVRRDLGDTVYGERKTETRAEAIARGYTSGSKDTAYQAEDLVKTPMKNELKEEVVDIFADSDEDEDDI